MSTELAVCVITNIDSELLLIHANAPGREQWELPGGKVEHPETPPQTGVREVGEELGVEVEITDTLDTSDFEQDGISYKCTFLRAKIMRGKPHIQEPKNHDDWGYFAPERVRKTIGVSHNLENFVRKIIDGEIKL